MSTSISSLWVFDTILFFLSLILFFGLLHLDLFFFFSLLSRLMHTYTLFACILNDPILTYAPNWILAISHHHPNHNGALETN